MIAFTDADVLASEAAQRFIMRIRSNADRPAVCLTGGSTPEALYRLLASPTYAEKIPWSRTHWFIGDDRFVPLEDKLSNMGMAKRTFLDSCAPAANVHAVPVASGDPTKAAQGYETELRAFYGAEQFDPARPLFDVVLMGIGPDGHTASLFPGDAALHETDRWVVGVDCSNVEPFVPRVTLTYPALASCREMIFMVSGASKVAVLTRAMAGDDLPATRARSNGVTTWLVDAAALGQTK